MVSPLKSERLLSILRCPACGGSVRLNGQDHLACGNCKKHYKLEDRTPIMLSEDPPSLRFACDPATEGPAGGIRDPRPTKSPSFLTRPTPRSERFYAWWWWRSFNRPLITDRTYLELLDRVPRGSIGLDLGSRPRVRDDAITLDITPGANVDLVADGHELPFAGNTFDYIWCNAVLEHVPYPYRVASEIARTLKCQGMAFIQVPFLEFVHGYPQDYFRFTVQGLRVLFDGMEEIAGGVSAGPGQVLADLLQYYLTLFGDIQRRALLPNVWCVVPGALLFPVRLLDYLLRGRSSYWQWARGYYFVARKPDADFQIGTRFSPRGNT